MIRSMGRSAPGSAFPGVEHWLPFFYDHLDRLGDYTGDAPLVFDDQAREAFADRQAQIKDYYEARETGPHRQEACGRRRAVQSGPAGPPLRDRCGALRARRVRPRSSSRPFAPPDETRTEDAGGRLAHNFAAERQAADVNLFEAVVDLLQGGEQEAAAHGHRVLVRRLARPHGAGADAITACAIRAWPRTGGTPKPPRRDDDVRWSSCRSRAASRPTTCSCSPSRTSSARGLLRPQRRKKASDALTEAASLAAGDLVVHVDHGIGRFLGLKQIEAMGAPHDCVEIQYANDTKLYLPVENIELLSPLRFGRQRCRCSTSSAASPGRRKKAKLKKRIRDMAEQLIKIAAQRLLVKAEPVDINSRRL